MSESKTEAADAVADKDAAEEVVDVEVVEQIERRMTIAAAKDDESDVLKEGELTKHGGSGSFTNWRKRWFVLTPDSLAYYDTRGGTIKGGLLLEQVSKIRPAERTEAGKHPNCFVIETPTRNYLQSSAGPEDAEEWEKLITAAVAQLSGSASSAGAEGADDFDDAEPVDKVVATEAARRVTISLTRSVKGPGGSGILKEGELSKQGGTGFMSNWRTRWFILTPDSLAYYEKKDGMVKGGILLETATKVRAADPTEGGKKPNCFVVETPNRNYVQSSATPADAEGWIKAIDASITALKGGETPAPPAATIAE